MQIKFNILQAEQVVSSWLRRSFVFLKDEHKKTTWGKSTLTAELGNQKSHSSMFQV